ncbi:MAG: methionyl-tRNA formyltransferase [Kiritimatiellae bacterium]|nr:methionyl-tRNA formyltransferase [Kiritimatiellia bacterium]
MRIVFMGSSEASAYTLRAILKSPLLKVVGMVTQPDRPSGRRQRFTPCPCKAYAIQRGVEPIVCPEKINAPEVLEQIAGFKPDVIVVVAFGQFLGKRLLALPPHGCLNGHFSLLPKYRGAAPVQAAIASGDAVTGVTIMRMAEGMDDGDMLLHAIEPICSDDTAVTLMDRLAILNAVTMVKALKLMINGELKGEPQNHALATFASKMQKADGLIGWDLPAAVIERRVRAFDPWPGAFTFMPERLRKPGWTGRIKVLQAEILKDVPDGVQTGLAPGTVCGIVPTGPVVATGDRALCLTAVQPDGSRRMDGKSFLNGHPMVIGDRFTDAAEGVQL